MEVHYLFIDASQFLLTGPLDALISAEMPQSGR